ncbi:MAG: VOC family protein [Acidimicrobiales bacterium]
MLRDAQVRPMLAVTDLTAAKDFYGQKLGLESVFADDDVLIYSVGSSQIAVYVSTFAGTNKATAAAFRVKDVEGTVEALRAKGATFEHYDDLPETTRKGDVHYSGDFMVAWCKDPAGNILSIEKAD